MRIQSAKAMLTVDPLESGGLGREEFQKVRPLAELLQILDFSPTSRPAIQLMWILKITAWPEDCRWCWNHPRQGGKMAAGCVKMASASYSVQRRKPTDPGRIPVVANVYIWARERRKGRLWDAPKGLIVGGRKHKVGLMEDQNPRTFLG